LTKLGFKTSMTYRRRHGDPELQPIIFPTFPITPLSPVGTKTFPIN
jgi:hypothetical protein